MDLALSLLGYSRIWGIDENKGGTPASSACIIMLRIETGFEAQNTLLAQKVSLCLKTCLAIKNVMSCFLVWDDII